MLPTVNTSTLPAEVAGVADVVDEAEVGEGEGPVGGRRWTRSNSRDSSLPQLYHMHDSRSWVHILQCITVLGADPTKRPRMNA